MPEKIGLFDLKPGMNVIGRYWSASSLKYVAYTGTVLEVKGYEAGIERHDWIQGTYTLPDGRRAWKATYNENCWRSNSCYGKPLRIMPDSFRGSLPSVTNNFKHKVKEE